MIFARTYMVIAWNLMCRASNAFGIHYGHMEWSGDALCVYFAHMKNDQSGDRPRDPRHVYANPFSPPVCPILALGIYWSCFQFDDGCDLLFPGGKQYDRFRKVLVSVLDDPSVVAELERRGIDPDEIGTHSLRKGAATYCSSGSTACPPSSAVHLRAGWSMGGVQNTYIRYESAGDMYVGRTVSGLPISSADFAILPPNFTNASPLIGESIELMFPQAPLRLRYILEFALASLVFHYDYLKSVLPSDHAMLNTPLFLNSRLIDELRPLVSCGVNNSNSKIHPSGIPPHVAILSKLTAIIDQVQSTLNALGLAKDEIIRTILGHAQHAHVDGSSITYDGIESILTSCLQSSGVLLSRDVEAPPIPPNSHCPQPDSIDFLYPTMPSNFVMPNGKSAKCGCSICVAIV